MKFFTREELEKIGMAENQIEAILKQQGTNTVDSFVEQNIPNNVNNVNVRELNDSNITLISDIQRYCQGVVVELPGFDGVHPFVAKLKRPSLLVMSKTGKIPNSLINQATQLFQQGAGALGKDNTIGDMYDIMEAICEAALVKPSYKELRDAGISLTDEQMMAIFSYTQQGVKALESFR